jgi:hypothetical protein
MQSYSYVLGYMYTRTTQRVSGTALIDVSIASIASRTNTRTARTAPRAKIASSTRTAQIATGLP